MKIGIISDSLLLDFPASVQRAASLGASGIQKYLTFGDFVAENMTPARIAEIKDIMSSNGLVFSAICGDFGLDLDHPEVVEKSKKVLYSAKELGCNIVTTHIGHLYLEEDARMELIRKNARELAEYADSIGSVFAAETGTEKAPVLKAFLDSLGAKGLRVNLDPANLVMVAHDDPVAAVDVLKDYIVHTHAKDGVMNYFKDPEFIYGIKHDDALVTAPSFEEVPLGEGSVPWDKYLAALDDIGFKGFLTIEREVGDDPAKDIGMAVKFLQEKMK